MAQRAVSSMRSRAASTAESTSQIVNSALLHLDNCVLGVMPPITRLGRMIQRAQQTSTETLPIPLTLNEVPIPLPDDCRYYHVTEPIAEDSLLADKELEGKRILIFGRSRNIDILRESAVWYVFGTFLITPEPFYQVFAVIGGGSKGSFPYVRSSVGQDR